MPEGDTIHRTAATLQRLFEGKQVADFEAPRLSGALPGPGDVIDTVEARGKHLLIHFVTDDDARDLSLRTHMRMNGSWHVYRPGESWQKSRAAARVILEVEDAVAVCFAAPVVEVLPTADMRRHPELVRLGPDLCVPDVDVDLAVKRMQAHAAHDVEVGVALLDQRIACGVGNVYKSEVAFACRINPFTPVSELDDDQRRELLATASRLLRANLDGHRRRTVRGGLAVYDRANRPCRRCATLIRSRRQGEQARTTYWCPSCQPAHSQPPGD